MRCILSRLLWVAALLPAAGWSQQPFAFDSAPGRLPKDVVPLDYSLDIAPNIGALSISGSESVTLQVRAATSSLRFNSLNETLRDVRFDGQPVQQVQSDDAQQLTTVTLTSPATVGLHTLSFAYTGRIETLARGLFVQPFTASDRQPALLLSTKFESTDARRMFPCWDEPAFRATFQLSFTVPAGWATVSNMPIATRQVHGDLATTTFRRSPRMPSYLVEFTAGELAVIRGEAQGVQLGVWAVRGRERDGATALASAQQILADYNEFFDYRYPLPKLDSIAMPGGFAGAMENWGAITYNDQLLLLTADTPTAIRQAVFSAQSHEMAHQWNGDLVTMGWWDDIWLNESFASWMAAKETERRHPEWHWLQSRDAEKQDAMEADALPASHAIQQPVNDELQAIAVFDPQITYRKGEAILRMFEAYIGPEAFRSGVRRYIKAHAFSNARTADLWDALSLAGGNDLRPMLSGWIQQAGYPLVSVAAECGAGGARTLRLSQRRFLLMGEAPEEPDWSIPLQIRVGTAAPQALLLSADQQTATAGRCDQPLSVNADGAGFFRVRYDAETLAVDVGAFDRLPDADRVALLDDQWAFVQSGSEPLSSYLRLVASMGGSLETRAWEQIAGALAIIEIDEQASAGHDAFAAYARALLRPTLDQLGWSAKGGEDSERQRLRRILIGELGAMGDPDAIAYARRRFAAFLNDRRTIAPDEQVMVLALVAQYADGTTFEQLHALAQSAADEAQLRRYYSALSCVEDAELAMRAAEIALSSEIPPRAGSIRIGLIVRLARDHPALAWNVFTQHASVLLSPFGRYAPLISAQQVPGWFWNGVPLEDIERWVRAQVPAEMAPNIERGLQMVRLRLAQKHSLPPAADAFIRGASATPG
jgi:aminopeptidase N